jgi:hypothetical protein
MATHRIETLTCDTDGCTAQITACGPLDTVPVRQVAADAGWAVGGTDRCPKCAHLANPLAARWRQLRGPARHTTPVEPKPRDSCWVCDAEVTVQADGRAERHPFSADAPDCPGADMRARLATTGSRT